VRSDLSGVPACCYGCFGPQATPNTNSLTEELKVLGVAPPAVQRLFRTFNANAPAFKAASTAATAEATAR